MSGVVCVVCPFADNEKLKNIFVLSFFLISFFPEPPFFACVCVSHMYVRAYLAIPCASADDNVKYTKSNSRLDNKINQINKMKQM